MIILIKISSHVRILNEGEYRKLISYRKRLQEGFYFAHYCAGICNMVLEVQMKVPILFEVKCAVSLLKSLITYKIFSAGC